MVKNGVGTNMHFSHDYFKLDFKIFPTVRSPKYVKKNKLFVGQIEEIYVKGNRKGFATLIAEEKRSIAHMSLAFLKYDSSSVQTSIETRQDYVDLLNSFIQYGSNRLTTIKSILWWRWE